MLSAQRLITELQSHGLRLGEAPPGAAGRRGGAGPSDHRAITIAGTTVMVPVYTDSAAQSPYTLRATATGPLSLEASGEAITSIDLPNPPQFYGLSTADGIPYWKIALLHGRDVLATTVQQTCRRYRDPATACQFCAIEKSLDAGRTIARKTPEQLAEVAAAAVRLDGVTQMIMTTGTPHTSDRGAAYLTDCAAAIRLTAGGGRDVANAGGHRPLVCRVVRGDGQRQRYLRHGGPPDRHGRYGLESVA